MDIKLIRNFKGGQCIPVEDDMVLSVTDTKDSLDKFAEKSYALVDIDTNVKQEIMPEVRKYSLYEFIDVTGSNMYLYFTTAVRYDTDSMEVSVVRYSIETGVGDVIHRAEYAVSEFRNYLVKVVVADENYLIIQIQEQVKSSADAAYIRLKDIYMYNIPDGTRIEIADKSLIGNGFDTVIPVDGNICAIKIGMSNLEYRMYGLDENAGRDYERIGIVNFRQFISDLVLQKEEVTMEILDEGTDDITFPYIKMMEGRIIYSRADVRQHREDIIVYDYLNDVTKIRVNDNLTRISDIDKTYLINDTLYFLQVDERCTKLINLDTQRTEWRLGNDYRILYIKNDIIVVWHHVVHRLLRREDDYILVYRFPDIQNRVLQEKAVCADCAVGADGNLMIFCR